MEDKQSAIYKLRHSLAHVLAQAVLEIRPESKLAFGPPVDDGCYYDFLFETPLSDKDFPDIEKRVRRIIAERQVFTQSFKTPDEAEKYLAEHNQNFKVEYCKELAGRGNDKIGFYTNGSFTDMCEGPHVEHTGQIPPDSFSIDTLAGAYWRGSEKNPQLTRIYLLAFENKQKLAEYKANRELAKARDHRKLGKELELFMIADEVGPGLPLWMPNGTVVRDALENFAKETETRYGYQRVSTPHLAKEELYIKSGHLPYYKETMFPGMKLEGESTYYLKAMNCPHHHLIYGHRPRSYRELPLRLAEYGTCYRYEATGSLSGLLRVRSLCMNDAHIYCRPDQIGDELKSTCKMIRDYYQLFRFKGKGVRFSTHDPMNTEKFIDNPEAWKYTEQEIEKILKELDIPYFVGKGEAAFYGPKIDFQAETLLGREETMSTTQLDFAGALRFNLNYIGEDGKEHRPYIVHRAPLSTHERFLAFLIEHFGGAFPTWMAPHQVKIIPVNESVLSYASELEKTLQHQLIRVSVDTSDNSFNKKIREATTVKIPNIIIIGGKEAEAGNVTLRRYAKQQNQETMTKDSFLNYITQNIRERIMDNFAD